MGKLVGLIGSGIGLAMEARTSYQSSSNKTNISRDISRGPSSTVVPQVSRRTLPKEYQSSNDEQAYQDLQVYAEYQNNLSDRMSADLQRSENYRRYVAEGPRARSNHNPYERDISFYAHELQDPRVQSVRGLSCPVIIPQRRPEDQSRGIIRAYSPELSNCGIDQETFLGFIDEFNEAHKSSPYLDAVNVAALGVGFAPGIAPMVVSMVVPIAVRAAKGYQTQRQSSSFLDRANAELFVPHGLFAMILTFKPDQALDPDEAPGQMQLPVSAPLLYPEDGNRVQRAGIKRMGHFIADYGDRRAQARYAYHNPDSSLASPMPQFSSRWADPNHPSNSGGLKTLLTGVPDDRKSRKQEKEDCKREKRGRRRRESSSSESTKRRGLLSTALGTIGEATGRRDTSGGGRSSLIGTARGMISGPSKQDQSLIKGIKGLGMKTDILYLMITNNTEDRSTSSTRAQAPLVYSPPQNENRSTGSHDLPRSLNHSDSSAQYQDQIPIDPTQHQNSNPYIGASNQVASSSSAGYFDLNEAPPAYREAMQARYYDQVRRHDEEFCVPTL